MSNIVLLVDVTSDLKKEVRERFNIDYVKGHMTITGAEDIRTDLDWGYFKNPDEFYATLKNKKNNLSTSPANVDELKEVFEGYINEGKEIIYFAMSSALSGSYNFATIAKEQLLEQYKNAKIEIIDTLRYSGSLGLLAIYAREFIDQGHNFEETVEYVYSIRNKIHQMGPMDDLLFLAKKGRISKGKAFMGTLVGIKPMGDINDKGLTTILIKEKGLKKALNLTIKYIENTIENPHDQIIIISNTDRKEEAAKLKALIEEKIQPKEIIELDCQPADAINIGPGLYAAYYFGKEISKDCEEEKKLIESLQKNSD